MGYYMAGFEVFGVDINPQQRYPFDFIQADAIEYLIEHGNEFDVIHASPPCQRYSNAQRIQGKDHPDYIARTRDAMPDCPWIIENVLGAPLANPITLCGHTFGLGTYRHRLFETSFDIEAPEHKPHDKPTTKMGRPPRDGEMMHVVGNFSGAQAARVAMGIDWMTRDELRESIPPAYTEYIGKWIHEPCVH